MCGWTPHERGEGRTECLWRKKARVDQDFWSSVCWPWRWAEWVSIGRGICLVKRVNQQSWFQRLWITAHLHKKGHKRQKSVPLRGAESSFKGWGWMWLSWKVNRKIQDWKAGGSLRSGSPWLGSKGLYRPGGGTPWRWRGPSWQGLGVTRDRWYDISRTWKPCYTTWKPFSMSSSMVLTQR